MGQSNAKTPRCTKIPREAVRGSSNEWVPHVPDLSVPKQLPVQPQVLREEHRLQEAMERMVIEDNRSLDKKVFVYVLLLEHDKYYIGQTSNLEARLKQHFDGIGSEWTKRHKPTKVVETFKDCDIYDEDKHTFRYFQQYGIDNVRGGAYCRIDLTREEIKSITTTIRNANGCCLRCGKKGHFATYCREVIKEEVERPYKCTFCDKRFDSDKGRKFHEDRWCRSNKNSMRYKDEHP